MNPEIIEISIGLIQINSSYVCLKRNRGRIQRLYRISWRKKEIK